MPEVEMLKNLAGGGGIAFALVVIFLRFMKDMHVDYASRFEASMTSMADKFNTEHTVTRTAFQSQIQESQKSFQEQVNAIVGECMKVTRETVVAVKGLESAVRELQNKIK